MNFRTTQRRNGSVSVFDRACAVLCLLLLCFSVGHTAIGHGDLDASAGVHFAQVGQTHQIAPIATDTQDTCALCAVMAAAAPLHVFSVDVPQTAKPRPPVAVAIDGAVTGWHDPLSCRPPPVA